ncbi:MAG: 16S rRNA (cytosine(1402)-N(4))-methyltransferase RsmH [Saprospiraceae bacterium]|nr:16S rRNA (cytosine(1402)-N(4))-methyltransferase RsmH [Saprospiraceae bacterium]
MKPNDAFHKPVLLDQSVEGLISDRDGLYVDATFGGGGHAKAILDNLSPKGRLFAFDQDKDALANNLHDDRCTLIHSNFRFIRNFLRYHGVVKVHGILADLGVSSFQLDELSKGFSFDSEDLDMRMNPASPISAADLINQLSEKELLKILSEYGEVRNAKTLARAIVQARLSAPIKNTQNLIQAIEPVIMGHRTRYLAQVFQAIRIKVNDEIGALKELLTTSIDILAPRGRLVIITYHSVEDRVVKHFMKSGNFGPDISLFNPSHDWLLKTINKKPIRPDADEIRRNRRSRSAKLRIAERI